MVKSLKNITKKKSYRLIFSYKNKKYMCFGMHFRRGLAVFCKENGGRRMNGGGGEEG
jgi:hypothetical protein